MSPIERKYRNFRGQVSAKKHIFATSIIVLLMLLLSFTTMFVMVQHESVKAAATTDFDSHTILTIDHNKILSPLSNFPVLVYNSSWITGLNETSFSFFDSDGSTECNWELDEYNSGSGKLVAWVNVTSISSSADTKFYLYYDNANSSDGGENNPTGTWDSDFLGVWHMSESSGAIQDSTSNNNDGSVIGTSTYEQTGRCGKSIFIQGSNDGFGFGVDKWSENDFIVSGDGATLLSFAKYDDTSTHNTVFMIESRMRIKKATIQTGHMYGGFYNAIDGSIAHVNPASDLTDWTYCVITASDSNYSTYIEGVLVNYTATSQFPDFDDCSRDSRIGLDWEGLYDAIMYGDEFQLSRTVRNQSWNKATFYTMNLTAGFLTWGIAIAGEYTLVITNNTIFTWSGEAGDTIWANSTGATNETGYIYTNLSGTSDNCTAIHIDISDFDSDIFDNNVSIEVINVSDGSWDGTTHQITEANGNVTLNSNMWSGASWCHGTDPFPIVEYNSTLAFRLKLEIPSDAGAGIKTNSATWYVVWKVVS